MVFGMQRKIDSLGRIVLPKEIRQFYYMKENDNNMEILPTDDGVLIRKPGYRVILVNEPSTKD